MLIFRIELGSVLENPHSRPVPYLVLCNGIQTLTRPGGELKPQEVVALGWLVLLLYQQFGFPSLFGNCPSGVLGSALWQSGSVDSLPSAM